MGIKNKLAAQFIKRFFKKNKSVNNSVTLEIKGITSQCLTIFQESEKRRRRRRGWGTSQCVKKLQGSFWEHVNV